MQDSPPALSKIRDVDLGEEPLGGQAPGGNQQLLLHGNAISTWIPDHERLLMGSLELIENMLMQA